MTKSFIGGILLVFLLLAGIWFFAIKEYDYSGSFQINEVPGEVYQKLLIYNYKNFYKTEEVQRIPFKKIIHRALHGRDTIEVVWELTESNDPITIVKAGINHLNEPFWKRLKYLSASGGTKKEMANELSFFKTKLEKGSDLYKVKISGITDSPATTCACLSLENEAGKKAETMMKTINFLSDFILENQLQMTGRPRVIIKSWNPESNVIRYDFCFPIAEGSSYKATAPIEVKTLPSRRSIKAVFNGNYMFSHFAWARIVHYAEEQGIEVFNQPQEVFNNNPEMGGDPILWEAEIYIPLKKN